MSIAHTKLLRRTLAMLGAGMLLATSHPALSQGTVTLSNGQSCQYSQMTVQPNGSIAVTCVTGTPTPTGAVFALSAPTSLPVSSPGSFTIARSGGPAEDLTVNFSVTGAGCLNGAYPLTFAPGGAAQTIPLTMTADGGYCIVSITAPSGHQVVPASVTITVGSGTPPPPPPPQVPAGCPTPPANYLYQTMDKWKLLNGAPATSWASVDQLRMATGQIATYDAIAPPNPSQTVALAFTQGQQAAMPSGYSRTEFSVSRCPGVIDASVPQCYHSSGSSTSNLIKIYRAPVTATGWNSQELVGTRGCYAPDTDASGQPQKWYVNVRWTYTSCAYSNGCGFSMQWSQADPY